MPFKSGIFTAIICLILWILFDQIVLNHCPGIKSINSWIKHSYRKSIVMTIAISSGYFTVLNRALDIVNSFIGVITMLLLCGTYYFLYVSYTKWRYIK